METEEIIGLVLGSLRNILSEQDQEFEKSFSELDENTRLLGRKSVLDSLNLVSLIVDVEQRMNDLNGFKITIADERAMSLERSPFLTVRTLSEYVEQLIKDAIAAA